MPEKVTKLDVPLSDPLALPAASTVALTGAEAAQPSMTTKGAYETVKATLEHYLATHPVGAGCFAALAALEEMRRDGAVPVVRPTYCPNCGATNVSQIQSVQGNRTINSGHWMEQRWERLHAALELAEPLLEAPGDPRLHAVVAAKVRAALGGCDAPASAAPSSATVALAAENTAADLKRERPQSFPGEKQCGNG